jgi:5'-3' exonuclease
MVQRIKGMSAEKAVQFLQKWETLAQFYQEAREWEQEIEEENERLGDGPAGRGKPKRRKKEDFVVSNLEDVGPRSIKGALGTKIWEFFMTEQGRYTS